MIYKGAIVAVVLAAIVGFTAAESCISCNSASDPNCVTAPWLVPPKACANQSNEVQCYTRVVNTETLRGCTDEIDRHVLDNCATENTCQLCSGLDGQVCNNAIFPAHRLECHQCVGALNSNCSSAITTNPQPCPVFLNEDSCFTWRSEKSVQRGCLSSSENRCKNVSHCLICNGHGCNRDNSTSAPLSPSSSSILQPILPIFVAVFVAFHVIKN